MFSKLEVSKMKKGFHPSRTGKSENAIVGRGALTGNRKERRSELNHYGIHNPKKKGLMLVIGRSRFYYFVQRIDGKQIEHYLPINAKQ